MFDKKLPSKQQVLDALFQVWSPSAAIETVHLTEAAGRVLAEPQYADVTLPVVRASMMDGVAVDSSRFAGGHPDTSAWMAGRDFVRADTGDDFPDAYDCVIPIEEVALGKEGSLAISPRIQVKKGMNVRPRGSTVKEGALLMERNLPIRFTDLSVLALGGKTQVPVYKKPRVAFIPSGSELVPIGQELKRGQNIDSNSLMAKQTLMELGAEPILYPIVPDNLEEIKNVLHKALETADMVFINGGSSKGDEDYSARLLREEGKLVCHWAAAGPGRPLCVSVFGEKLAVVIPGPPPSAFHVLEWFVTPVICRFLNVPTRRRPRLRARLSEAMHCPPFEFLTRVNVTLGEDGGYWAIPLNFRGGGLLDSMSSNALFLSPMGESEYPQGSEIEVELLRGTELIKQSGDL